MGVKKLLFKLMALASPLMIFIVAYLLLDPFHVIYAVGEYYPRDGSIKNVDYIGSELYLKSANRKKYDSFIFGSSRSEAIKAKKWKEYIEGTPFHFHASGEGVWGIARKIKFLDESGAKLKNAIILLDFSCLKITTNPDGVLFIKHPVTSQTSWEKFHLTFFKAFFNDFFFIRHINYRFFDGKFYPALMDNRKYDHDTETNDIYYRWYDEEIARDSIGYFNRLAKKISYGKNDTTYYNECINHLNKPYLESIAAILKRHGANSKIIISPDNDRIFLNSNDILYLRNLFGDKNVYDFSGINYFTTKVYHYYDSPHFRPVVADSILKIIYAK